MVREFPHLRRLDLARAAARVALPPLEFQSHCVDTLPPLAWCALLRRGEPRAKLPHGPAVEARGDWFVEGAWNGPFEADRFDRAHTLAGTGGRCDEAGLRLCAAAHFYDGLFTLPTGPERLVSNSLVFALARAGDDLDPAYPHDAEDLAEYRRNGLRRQQKTLHTQLGNRVRVHTFTGLLVSPDLSLCELARPDCEEPADFAAYRRLPGPVDAEFCACPTGGATPIAALERELTGTLLVDGRFGDAIWHKDPREHLPELRQLRRGLWMTLNGCSHREFRLRVGYLSLPVPCIGARHDRRIQQLAVSSELQPWSIRGRYDRPLPRRIAESAGVSREWLGQKKTAGLNHDFYRHGLTPAGQRDFSNFYATIRHRAPLSGRLRFGAMRALYAANAAAVSLGHALGDRFRWRRVWKPMVNGRCAAKVAPLSYTCPWGIRHVRPRYEIAE